MRAGERLVAQDGYEVALFPMPYLYMSQDEGGDYSHIGTYNIDFLGWGENGRIYQAPIYAPVTLKMVDIWNNYQGGNNQIFESTRPVHLANGNIDYLTITFAHDNNPIHSIGDIIQQGDLLCHTGTYGNVTGDHTHTCCGQGTYQGYTTRPPQNHQDLTNRIHYWDAVFVNDTVIERGFNHNWITWTGPIPPTPIFKRSKFPWVLYAKKIRET